MTGCVWARWICCTSKYYRAREIGRMLEEARHRPLGEPTMTVERAEELIAEIRADRDGR